MSHVTRWSRKLHQVSSLVCIALEPPDEMIVSVEYEFVWPDWVGLICGVDALVCPWWVSVGLEYGYT